MDNSNLLFSGNENLILRFDDDGEELHPGDQVRVNHEQIAMVGEVDGKRTLVGWPNDCIVHHLELITETDSLTADWPDSL